STHFVSLAVIAGIYLIVEAIFISMKRHNFQFVELTKSNRGIWIGRYRLSKLAFIPFLVFLPVAGDGGIIPFSPYFEFGGQSFQLLLLPFFIGYNYKVESETPKRAASRLSRET